MSYWTHIVGVIHAETYHETDDIKAYVEEQLNKAPPITGSESIASIFVNAKPGHNRSTSCDCGRCYYGDTVRYCEDGFECDAPDNHQCPWGEYQTCVIITICGDLRGRFYDQTRKEWNVFHRYLAKSLGWTIRIATCRIE